MTATSPKLRDFKVLLFDVYGTLADWETGIYTALRPLLSRFSSASQWTREQALLAFTSVEKDLQTRFPDMLYADLLAKAHQTMEQSLIDSETAGGVTKAVDPSAPEVHVAFGNSIKNWPIFPDTTDALRALAKHYKLVVLSNVDRTSFAFTHVKLSEGSTTQVSDPSVYAYPSPDLNPHRFWFPQTIEGSKSPFTLILTAQDTGRYKPDIGGFIAALDCIQKEPLLLDAPTGNDAKDKVLVVAQSLFHDIEPASKLGIRSVWIDRQGASMGFLEGKESSNWTWRFESLGELAEAVEQETARASGN